MSERSPSGEPVRKRIKLACQACHVGWLRWASGTSHNELTRGISEQRKRSKCDGAQPRCSTCIKADVACAYVESGTKRGPPKGHKQREHKPAAATPPRHEAERTTSLEYDEHNSKLLDGISLEAQDHLLGQYFTHVHNVWPILYKPMFHPARTHPLLLLSMMAAASSISNPAPHPHFDGETIFRRAIYLLQQHRDVSRTYVVQALFLLAFAQVDKGNKNLAYLYIGQACAMALEMGLHRSSVGARRLSHAESESRSRTFWVLFVIDKAMSEETGKPAILASRRSTIPLPSINEADEFELWPPPAGNSFASAGIPIEPAQSRIISGFNATCQLGLIIEKILDLEEEGPRLGRHVAVPGLQGDRSHLNDDQIAAHNSRKAMDAREALTRELADWYAALPRELNIDINSEVCPMTHLVVNVAWYHSATILLHSRYISMPPDPQGKVGLYGRSHVLCTEAADNIVALLAFVDRFKLLSGMLCDVTHIISLSALFHAYNSSLPDVALANSAKLNFSQCCLWLRDISESWPLASAHRLFFEGLIQGGLEMAANGQGGSALSHALTPAPSADVADSPNLLNGASGRVYALATQHAPKSRMMSQDDWQGAASVQNIANNGGSNGNGRPDSAAWPNDLFQLPTLFWNDALGNPSLPDLGSSGYNTQASFNASLVDPAIASASSAWPFLAPDQPAGQYRPNRSQRGDTSNPSDDVETYNNLVSYMLEAVGKQART